MANFDQNQSFMTENSQPTYWFFFSKKQLDGDDSTGEHDDKTDQKDEMQNPITVGNTGTAPAAELQQKCFVVRINEEIVAFNNDKMKNIREKNVAPEWGTGKRRKENR